ncbi:ABC transporter permease [Legionella adelaidensis]|uniref:Transport permease protein n=1 Tax=Legionella adelaidensis TaxID=45056 RepID=A0A0W0R2D5_9GAMM|nr:ABC transporter permease [Legionella adelaidensis]KTC65267.1 ABC transporter permease [Legionella adelaidensis]
MTINQQFIAVYTLVRRELVRMFRIFSQVFLPPVITTLLYFLIFGSVIGKRIGSVEGVDYTLFIAPGLIMMAVITNAYANVSTSLFSSRFQKNIEEMLVSPLHYSLLLLGFVLGGTLRGMLVALFVFIVCLFFVPFSLEHMFLALLVVFLVATLFSLAGFANGMLARNFDDVAIVPTFILAPLTYLGGVFYTSNMLSPFWQKMMYFNPIFYMVNAIRHVMIGQDETNIVLALAVIVIMLVFLTIMNLILLKRGIGIRE